MVVQDPSGGPGTAEDHPAGVGADGAGDLQGVGPVAVQVLEVLRVRLNQHPLPTQALLQKVGVGLMPSIHPPKLQEDRLFFGRREHER